MVATGSSVSRGDELSGAWNFRDVAEETGIGPGRFLRSGELSGLDEAGGVALREQAVTDVADLRSVPEVERRGSDKVPDGIQVHLLPFRELGERAPHEQGFEALLAQRVDGADDPATAANRHMIEEYQKYPTLLGAQAAVRQVISLLADRRSVLVHCLAGKDRTGFTVAVVLEAAGVDRASIMADYLRSNAAVPRLRQAILDSVKVPAAEPAIDTPAAFVDPKVLDAILGVRAEYLLAARDVIDEVYGSFANYLVAIGVSRDQTRQLRAGLS